MTKKQEKPIDGAGLIREVMRLELRPGEVLVFRCERPILANYRVYLEKQLRRLFPDNRSIVIDGEFDLFVLGEAEVAAPQGGTSDTG